jgi:hypothetical protein
VTAAPRRPVRGAHPTARGTHPDVHRRTDSGDHRASRGHRDDTPSFASLEAVSCCCTRLTVESALIAQSIRSASAVSVSTAARISSHVPSLAELVVTAPHRLPQPELSRQIPQRRTRPIPPDDRFHHGAVIAKRLAALGRDTGINGSIRAHIPSESTGDVDIPSTLSNQRPN